MHSVKLIAQPRSKHPLVKKKDLSRGRMTTKSSGTFGLLWFTDFGEKFWEACKSIDENSKVKLRRSGFDEMDWAMAFRFAGFKARLTSTKYKGFFGTPNNAYLELRLGTQNPNDLRMFIQALITKFETPPWIINNWSKLKAKTSIDKEDIINAWSEAMGREINAEESEKKGWGFSLFGKGKTEDGTDSDDFEIFEDGDGGEIKMKVHGGLEVGGDEYAIMSYTDEGNTSDFEILKINRGKNEEITYTSIEDERLYEELSEAAIDHLEATGVV